MDYVTALDKLIHAQDTTASIEAVYEKGRLAAAKLMEVIEELDDSTYSAVVKAMKGFEVNRVEIVFVQPNTGFWIDLSAKKGKKADAKFFELYKQTYSNVLHEIYFEPQTDYSGCIKFGSNDLVRLYGEWTRYKLEFPRAYANFVKERLEEIENQLTEGMCACYGREDVLREFTAFVKTFPDAKITAKIQQRIQEIENNASEMRFNCTSEVEPHSGQTQGSAGIELFNKF
jgi:hypothetical protein